MKRFPKMADLSMEWYRQEIAPGPQITTKTKIVSMGSCFATHIKQHLVKHGYNYLQYESKKNPWVDIYPGDRGRHKSHYASNVFLEQYCAD